MITRTRRLHAKNIKWLIAYDLALLCNIYDMLAQFELRIAN
jgi:hypothetical protein